jgi:hypothetical protein
MLYGRGYLRVLKGIVMPLQLHGLLDFQNEGQLHVDTFTLNVLGGSACTCAVLELEIFALHVANKHVAAQLL